LSATLTKGTSIEEVIKKNIPNKEEKPELKTKIKPKNQRQPPRKDIKKKIRLPSC
jgi:hypothetical protein